MSVSRSGSPDDKLKSIMSRRRKRLDKLGFASGDFIAVDDPRYVAIDKVERAAKQATATVIASFTMPKNRHWLGRPPEKEIRTIEDLADYVDRERRSVDGLTHDDARGPKNQIALEIAIQAIENAQWALDEILGSAGYPEWSRQPTDVLGARRTLAMMAEWIDRQVTPQQDAKAIGQSDTESDNSENSLKKKRPRTPKLARCGSWVKEQMEKGKAGSKEEAVEQYVERFAASNDAESNDAESNDAESNDAESNDAESNDVGSFSYLIRGLSDHPDLWK